MSRIIALALGLAVLASPARADGNAGTAAGPLMMRRAGPSCRPGHLGEKLADAGDWKLGPCAGPDTGTADGAVDRRDVVRNRRRF